MPFIPTVEQVDSLYMLLQQFIREHEEIRVIRFINWADGRNPRNCDIEVCGLEDEDKYLIRYDGRIE